MSVGLVWFKCDLCLCDYVVLVEVVWCECVFVVFIIEFVWLQSVECDLCYVDFLLCFFVFLQIELKQCGLFLFLCIGEVVQVLEFLCCEWGVIYFFSYEEIGLVWSYVCDILVNCWSCIQGVQWQEFL